MPIDRDADLNAWIDAVYRDTVIIIQVDDGAGYGPGLHTSPCSMPQVVLSMLTALDNPTTRRVRARWGGHVAGIFLRALAVMFLAAAVCGFTAVSVPNRAGATVFFVAMLAGFVKLIRLLLIVAGLLHGQRVNAQQTRP